MIYSSYRLDDSQGDSIDVTRSQGTVMISAFNSVDLTLAEARQLANVQAAMADEED